MQKIDGTTIELTRGDQLSFNLSLQLDDGTTYEFQNGDKIIFSVYNKKKMDEDALLKKTYIIDTPTEVIEITCTGEETKIGPYINKPVIYWYEIELNDEFTVLGYDDDGPKVLKLYPEGNNE